MQYQLVITGCIGSGKSTIIESIKEKINKSVTIVPEYINLDPEFGKMILDKFIKHEISNFTFQNFIIDNYTKRLNILNSSDSDIKIFERIPDDNLFIFGYSSHITNPEDIGDEEYKILEKRTLELDRKYNLPSYMLHNYEFTKLTSLDLNENINTILRIIENDIKNKIYKHVIGLEIDLKTCKERIIKRNRECEKKYSEEYLKHHIENYKNLYDKL